MDREVRRPLRVMRLEPLRRSRTPAERSVHRQLPILRRLRRSRLRLSEVRVTRLRFPRVCAQDLLRNRSRRLGH